jgi:PTH1 family peptidyl-tRNA hydrolase
VRIVLGLGNPGRRYERTRHNVGFRVADLLAASLGARFGGNGAEGVAAIARASIAGEDLVIAKPETWMNHSGVAAERLVARFGNGPSDLLVVYDDIALTLGSVRVRPSGRSAGQKGMESVIRTLGTEAIPRIRLGILGDRKDADLADYVLERFAPEEEEIVAEMIDRGAEAARIALESGIDQAMKICNRREPAPG